MSYLTSKVIKGLIIAYVFDGGTQNLTKTLNVGICHYSALR